MASCCFFGCRSLFTLMELLLNVSRICPWKVMLKLPRTYSPILLGMPCFEGMPCDKRRTTLIHLLLSVSKKGSSAKFLVRVNFAMKTPSSGFPTKAMFLPSYESTASCAKNLASQRWLAPTKAKTQEKRWVYRVT